MRARLIVGPEGKCWEVYEAHRSSEAATIAFERVDDDRILYAELAGGALAELPEDGVRRALEAAIWEAREAGAWREA